MHNVLNLIVRQTANVFEFEATPLLEAHDGVGWAIKSSSNKMIFSDNDPGTKIYFVSSQTSGVGHIGLLIENTVKIPDIYSFILREPHKIYTV